MRTQDSAEIAAIQAESLRPAEMVRHFSNAFITPFKRFVYKGTKRTRMVITGAVYDEDGVIVRESQRASGIKGDASVNDDPALMSNSGIGHNRAPMVPGHWIYGGHFFSHFGHFIVETLPNLWYQERGAGYIFTPYNARAIAKWQSVLLSRVTENSIMFVPDSGITIRRLAVPGRPTMLHQSTTCQAVNVWQRIAAEPRVQKRKVFLSRSGLGRSNRSSSADIQLDGLAEKLGFEVVHPQDLSIEDQLQTVVDAEILMGVSGSQMHLSAFALPEVSVIEIGDARTPAKPLGMQRVIDGAYGRESNFVKAYFHSDGERNLQETESQLVEILETL